MRLQHIGLAVRDIDQSLRQYASILGFASSTEVIEDKTQQVRIVFIQVSENVSIELIEPTTPNSPVARLVEQGGGVYHLCYAVEDIDKALLLARSGGAVVISEPVPAVAFDGRRVAFLILPNRA